MKTCDQNYFFCNLIAIKRLMRVPDRIRRQGFGGALSIWAPVPIASVATALVFRNEIADIVQDLVGNYRCIRSKNKVCYNCIIYPNTSFICFPFIFSLSLCAILDPTTTTTTAATTTAST